MNKMRLLILAVLIVSVVPSFSVAGDFDGSKPLLCAVIDVVECVPGGECQRVMAGEVDIPRFLRINFEDRTISGMPEGGGVRTTAIEHIEHIEHIDGKVVLQGAEDGVEGVRDGLGWTMAISEDTGKMVLTASGDDVGFVIFGACTPQ